MNNNNVNPNTQCMGYGCKVAEKCHHHKLYLDNREHWQVLTVLNTSILDITDEGCKHFFVPTPVMMARGFKAMYDTAPHSVARGLWKAFPHGPSRRQFYRLLSGEVMIEPDYQSEILAFFENIGANTSLGFDAMEEVMVE